MSVIVLGLLIWMVTKVEDALLVHLQEPRAKNSFYFTVLITLKNTCPDSFNVKHKKALIDYIKLRQNFEFAF